MKLRWNGWFGPIPRPDRWVFIVGCYNSGTTLLHDLLATHAQVGSMKWEGQFYTDQLPLPKDLGLPRLWALAPELFRLNEVDGKHIDVQRLKRQWGAQFNDHRRPVLIEKSPTNAGRTRWLQQHFENAHFIGLIRNGYAVAEGIRRKAHHPLERAARQWRVSNEIMLADFAHLQNRILVRYEELVEQQAVQLARVAQFLGLDPSAFGEDRVWNIHGESSPVQNLNARSLAHLSAEDCTVIRAEAGELLESLGYPEAPAQASV